MSAKATPKTAVAGAGDDLWDQLRQAELLYRIAFDKSCAAYERFEAAKCEQLAASDEVRRLRLALDESKA